MNNTLKYRFYDKKLKKMLPVTKMEWSKVEYQLHSFESLVEEKDDTGGQYTLYRGDPYKKFGDEKRFVLMQCTGLLDSNSKLIYEGDILRYPAGTRNDETERSYVGYEVFWHDNDCCANHIGWQCNRLRFYGNKSGAMLTGLETFKPEFVKKLIVIGNIWENDLKVGESNE